MKCCGNCKNFDWYRHECDIYYGVTDTNCCWWDCADFKPVIL